jgi:phosphoribosylanthranilate isomerase
MRILPKIKICGLKTVEQIAMINKYDVDYIGLVFAKSKRQISPDNARKMRAGLRSDIKAVGVFVDTPIEEINKITKYCSLDIVQLHGCESNEECLKSNVPVWKAISVKDKESLEVLKLYKSVEGFVFDSSRGGSGKTFCWDFIKGLSKDYFTVLAGGLNSENVWEGIKEISPHVVDISSGVETSGEKDEIKIKEFIRKVKSYETR